MGAIKSFSDGQLSIDQVAGKYACAVCRYILNKGCQGKKPLFQLSMLKESTGRCLMDFILYALDENIFGSKYYHAKVLEEAAN